METTTTRPRNSPPAPPPKPKSKAPYNNGSDHQQKSYEEHVNNNVENYYETNQLHTNGNHINNNTINNNHQYYSSAPPSHEQVVMTPRGKTSNSTVILIERKLVEEVSDRVHVAGGDHQGIIINKDIVKGIWDSVTRPRTPRIIFSFFRSKISKSCSTLDTRVPRVPRECKDRATHTRVANAAILVPRLAFRWRTQGAGGARFLPWTRQSKGIPKRFVPRNLAPVTPTNFYPPDYVGFIKKIMKQMQKGYNEIQSVEIELRILEQTSAPPSRPREYLNIFQNSPETEMATVRIKKVRFVDEVWYLRPWVLSWWQGLGIVVDSCKNLYFLFQLIKMSAPTLKTLLDLWWWWTHTARPGHLVYCFGDVDSRYCRGLSGSAGSDYIMKQIWLEFNG